MVLLSCAESSEGDVEISGRSKSHTIDQFVLFQTDKSLSAAQVAAWSDITYK